MTNPLYPPVRTWKPGELSEPSAALAASPPKVESDSLAATLIYCIDTALGNDPTLQSLKNDLANIRVLVASEMRTPAPVESGVVAMVQKALDEFPRMRLETFAPQIRALLALASSKKPMVEALGGGCDANGGGLHSCMGKGPEAFCPDCGLMLKRVAYVLPHVKPGEVRAALAVSSKEERVRPSVEQFEQAAKAAEDVGRIFGEKPPGGERGTNIVWDTATRIADRIRRLKDVATPAPRVSDLMEWAGCRAADADPDDVLSRRRVRAVYLAMCAAQVGG